MLCGHPFIMTCRLKAKEGCEERLRLLLEDAVKQCSGQEGLMVYCLHQGKNDPAVFMLYEQFTSEASYRMHLDSDVIRKVQDKLIDILHEQPTVDFWVMLGKTGKKQCC